MTTASIFNVVNLGVKKSVTFVCWLVEGSNELLNLLIYQSARKRAVFLYSSLHWVIECDAVAKAPSDDDEDDPDDADVSQ